MYYIPLSLVFVELHFGADEGVIVAAVVLENLKVQVDNLRAHAVHEILKREGGHIQKLKHTYIRITSRVQSLPSPWIPIFGERFAPDRMFMFFAVLLQCSFWLPSNDKNNLALNAGIQGDGGICTCT